MPDAPPLNEGQAGAVALIEKGESIFLTGGAGVGKTWCLNDWLTHTNRRVAVTASTGIAATHLGGTTIHSWAGLGIGKLDVQSITRQRWWQFARKPIIREAEVLVVDEVSMLDGNAFTNIDLLCRAARGRPIPFGGIQVILVGDMGQLAPVSEQENGFPFETPAWWELGVRTVELLQVMRQKDAAFAAVLRQVRDGTLDDNGMHMLESRVSAFDPDRKEAVRLTTHNAEADAANDRKLRWLRGKAMTYTAVEGGDSEHLRTLDKSCLSPRVLDLKEGARVMFTKNDTPARRWCNGTLGRVIKLEKDKVDVHLDGGEDVSVSAADWGMTGPPYDKDGNPKLLAYRKQIPLRLAWSITVHKSQGMSLDSVSVDLYNCFAPGQAYVALSRARTLEGLNIERWRRSSIIAHPIVADFLRGRYVLPGAAAPLPPPPPMPEPEPASAAPVFTPTSMLEPGEPF